MIAPSDEDSFTFTVSAANGDIFKLRGKWSRLYYWPYCTSASFYASEGDANRTPSNGWKSGIR